LMPALFTSMFRKNNENWSYYISSMNEYPDETILKKTKAILIPGSMGHVYDNTPHLSESMSFLRKISTNDNYKHIKILGICFGMQMLSQSNGGDVQKRHGGVIKYVEEIKPNEGFWDLDFVKKSGVAKVEKINVCQNHGDEVAVQPDCFKLYGSSDTCKREIMLSNCGRILTFQGHPEFTPDFNFFRFYPSKHKNDPTGLEESHKHFISKYNFKADMSYDFRYICHSFMKS